MRSLLFDQEGTPHCDCDGVGHCAGPGKHPAVLWGNPWAPFDSWSRKAVENHVNANPSRGFGLHVGHSGLCVLDIDARNGGIESLRILCEQHGVDVPKYTTCSSAGGGHVYFRAPIHCHATKGFIGANGQSRCSIVIAPGVEMFFGQHLVLMAYSPHKSGCWYTVGPNQELLDLPQYLLNLVAFSDVFKVTPRAARPEPAPRAAERCGTGAGNVDRARAYLQAIPGAIDGEGGSAVTSRVAAVLLVDFGLHYGDAFNLFCEWNQTCVPPWTEAELHRKMAWGSKRPGEKGWKNAKPSNWQSKEQKELEWMDGVTVRVMSPGWVLNVTNGKVFRREVSTDKKENSSSDVISDIVEATLPVEKSEEKPANRPHKPSCNCYFSLLMRHQIKNLFRLMRIPARRWDCPACGPARRKHMKDTHEKRLRDWAATQPDPENAKLYHAWITGEQRVAFVKAIRRRKGKFFRLDPHAFGSVRGIRYLVVSSVLVPGISAMESSVEETIIALNAIVDSWPETLKIRVWWSSWAWKLLPDEDEKQKQWCRIGKIKCSIAEQRKILEEWGVHLKVVTGRASRYPWWAEQGKYRADQWEMIRDDLECGFFTGGKTWRDYNFVYEMPPPIPKAWLTLDSP